MSKHEQDLIKQIEELAGRAFATHTCHLLDSGSRMRLWRCQKPQSCAHQFDVLVLPGQLIVTGDNGLLVLTATTNMVQWFRQSGDSLYYVHEKVARPLGTVFRQDAPEVFAEKLREVQKRELDSDDAAVLAGAIQYLDNGKYTVAEARARLYYDTSIFGDEFPSALCLTPDFLWGINALRWWLANCDPAELQDGQFTHGAVN